MKTFLILYAFFASFFVLAFFADLALRVFMTAAQRRAEQRRLLDQLRTGGAVHCPHERARQIERALFREPHYRTHPAPEEQLPLTPYVKPIHKLK